MIPLDPGVFSISLETISDSSRHEQYGFTTVGPDVWITDAAPLGSVQIAQIPEPRGLALALAGVLGLCVMHRPRRRSVS